MGKRDGTLAGLAALAGAAYLYNNQKNKDSNPTRAARPGSIETRKNEDPTADKETKRKILETITKPKEKSNDAAGNQGVLDSEPAPVKPVKPAPVKDVDPYANYEGGDLLTGAKLRTQPASNVADAVKNEEAAKSVAKAAQVDANTAANAGNNKAATKKYSEATDQYANLSHAAAVTNARKKQAALSRRSPGDEMSDYAAKQEALRNASRKTAVKNTATSAVKDAAKTAVNAATQGPVASTAPANKFEHEMPITKFFKGIRERGNKDLATRGMKRGGAVKMASGGMAASRRGDGIAQRGKTRGKMC